VVDEENNLIFIGVVGNAKGLKGNVQINYFAKDLSKFKSYKYFYVGEKKEKLKIQKHFISGDNFSLKFFDINSREEAESLKNKDVFIESTQLKKLDDESWYHSEIIGLSVETMKGNLVGEVKAIYNFGAGDIIEIKLISGKIEMIPFTKDFVQDIKINNKLIIKEMDN
jgi:16S rRNA processing protein RimM